MIDMLTEAGLEPALLLVLTERLPINGPGHIYLKPTSYLIAISSIGSWMMLPIPIPLLCRTDWPVRPTLHHGLSHDCDPLLCLSHLSHARSLFRKPRVLIAFCKCGHDQLYNDGCLFHSIYYSSCIPQLGVQLITSSVGFVAPSSLHSQLYHIWFYLSSIIFIIFLIISAIFYWFITTYHIVHIPHTATRLIWFTSFIHNFARIAFTHDIYPPFFIH